MRRFLLIFLVTFLTTFIILGALTIYVRYGGQDHIMPPAIEVVD